jgi:hypothetical protein
MQMDILLREWNLNAGFLEGPINCDRELAPGKEKLIDGRPAEQSKIERAVSEPIENSKRRRIR